METYLFGGQKSKVKVTSAGGFLHSCECGFYSIVKAPSTPATMSKQH